MEVVFKQVFYGPNIYSNEKCLVIEIALKPAVKALIPTFQNSVSAVLPSNLKANLVQDANGQVCNGQFFSTFSFNLVNSVKGAITAHGAEETEMGYRFWLGFERLLVTTKIVEEVLNLFVLFVNQKGLRAQNVQELINRVKELSKYHAYSLPLLQYAKRQGIPSFQCDEGSRLRQYGWGHRSLIFQNASPMRDSYHGVYTSLDKLESKRLLMSVGMPVAKSMLINAPSDLQKTETLIGYPCVVKPSRGAGGVGITANVINETHLKEAYIQAKNSLYGASEIFIEQHIPGHDHRLMVVHGQLVAAIERRPTIIKGDGQKTILDLIGEINRNRLVPERNPNELQPIAIDQPLETHLGYANLRLASVLQENEEVALSSTAAYSKGGWLKM